MLRCSRGFRQTLRGGALRFGVFKGLEIPAESQATGRPESPELQGSQRSLGNRSEATWPASPFRGSRRIDDSGRVPEHGVREPATPRARDFGIAG